jgi:hypothetical protein
MARNPPQSEKGQLLGLIAIYVQPTFTIQLIYFSSDLLNKGRDNSSFVFMISQINYKKIRPVFRVAEIALFKKT